MTDQIDYIIMDGLGNRFIILDDRETARGFSATEVRILADDTHAETGGCDQLVVLEGSDVSDCFMRIYNADGGEVDACGNVTRCVGWLLSEELCKERVVIDTQAGQLFATCSKSTQVSVDMGRPRLEWQEIPLKSEMNTLHLDINDGELADPVAVSMGNPHMVFFVDDVDAIDFEQDGLGKRLESHVFYPEKTNVGVAQIVDRSHIKLRVFERAVGETLACGTGACAAAVAAMRREQVERNVTMHLRGGNLQVRWDENGHVVMTGETHFSRRGVLSL